MAATHAKGLAGMRLSGGASNDGLQGKLLLEEIGLHFEEVVLLGDRAYDSESFRLLAQLAGYKVHIPPKKNTKQRGYDKELYKRRNEVERLFRRIKHFRRIFTRYDKLDFMFLTFIHLAFIAIWIK